MLLCEFCESERALKRCLPNNVQLSGSRKVLCIKFVIQLVRTINCYQTMKLDIRLNKKRKTHYDSDKLEEKMTLIMI